MTSGSIFTMFVGVRIFKTILIEKRSLEDLTPSILMVTGCLDFLKAIRKGLQLLFLGLI